MSWVLSPFIASSWCKTKCFICPILSVIFTTCSNLCHQLSALINICFSTFEFAGNHLMMDKYLKTIYIYIYKIYLSGRFWQWKIFCKWRRLIPVWLALLTSPLLFSDFRFFITSSTPWCQPVIDITQYCVVSINSIHHQVTLWIVLLKFQTHFCLNI